MADYAKAKGYAKAYVLYNNDDDYSVGLKDAFVETFGAANVTAVGYGKDVKDFKSYWAPIKEGGFECVYLPDYYENVYNILKTGYAEGYTGVCYGGDGWDGVIQQVKEGDDVSFLEKCFYTNHYFGKSDNAAVKKFVDAYKAKYDGEVPVSFAALAYDAVYIAKQAIEQAGSVDYAKVVEALTNGTFTGLVTSSEGFKFVNGNPEKAATVITFKDGKSTSFQVENAEQIKKFLVFTVKKFKEIKISNFRSYFLIPRNKNIYWNKVTLFSFINAFCADELEIKLINNSFENLDYIVRSVEE